MDNNTSTKTVNIRVIRLIEYVLTLSLASLIMYFVFNKIIGDPKDIKSSSIKITTIENQVDTVLAKLDTTMAIQGYVTDRISILEENQAELHQTIDETNKLIKQTNREINTIKRQLKEHNETY